MIIGEVSVFPYVDQVGVGPVVGRGGVVIVFGDGAVVEAWWEVQMAGKIVGAPVVTGSIPGGNEFISDITGSGGVGIKIDHVTLVAPD